MFVMHILYNFFYIFEASLILSRSTDLFPSANLNFQSLDSPRNGETITLLVPFRSSSEWQVGAPRCLPQQTCGRDSPTGRCSSSLPRLQTEPRKGRLRNGLFDERQRTLLPDGLDPVFPWVGHVHALAFLIAAVCFPRIEERVDERYSPCWMMGLPRKLRRKEREVIIMVLHNSWLGSKKTG